MPGGIPLRSDKQLGERPDGFIARRFRKKWYADPTLLLSECGLIANGIGYPEFVFANTKDLERMSKALVHIAQLEYRSDRMAREAAGLEFLNFAPNQTGVFMPPAGWVWINVPAAQEEGLSPS